MVTNTSRITSHIVRVVMKVQVSPAKRARLERKTTRKKVCAERLLANCNIFLFCIRHTFD